MSAGRPTVFHLGRAGEVAGGMTQVLNGYLQWTFPRVDVEVITSRGDPHDARASVVLAAKAALRIVRLPRADSIVVAHLSERGSFLREGLLLKLASLRGIACVAHLHGSSFAEFSAAHPRLTAFALHAADRVITLSEESSTVSRRFVAADRVELVANSILPGSPRPKRRLVIFGGVVSHRKGIDVLQAAWRQLNPQGWELLVAGPVRDEELVEQDVPGVRFLGPLAHGELMNLLDESQIAVLPSREEAMPMFILEAMARGNAVVSTDVGGIGSVLAGGRGLVVAPGDVDALRRAMETVLTDDETRATFAEVARAAYEDHYSADAVFPRLEALWLSAWGERRGKRRSRPGLGALSWSNE